MAEEMNKAVTTAYIDRIEEVEEGVDKAVLYIGEDTETMIKIVLPVTLLPADACEGEYVTLTIALADADDDDTDDADDSSDASGKDVADDANTAEE